MPDPRSRPLALLSAITLLFVVAAAVAAPAVTRVVTSRGTLVIETDDPDVQVSVKDNGKLVTITDKKTNKQIELKDGELQTPLAEGLNLATGTFALRRGDKAVLTARLEPAAAPKPPEKPGELKSLKVAQGWVGRVAVSADGKQILAAGEAVTLWDAESGRKLKDLAGAASWAVGFSKDGKFALATCGGDKTVRVWEAESGKEARKVGPFEGGNAWAVALSHDGKRLFYSVDHKAFVFDAEAGKQLHAFEHTGEVRSIAVSPDGKYAVYTYWEQKDGANVGTLRIWDIAAGKEAGKVTPFGSSPTQVAFSPDAKFLAASDFDGKVRLRDVAAAKVARTFEGHQEGVEGVAYSPDGSRLLSAGQDKTVRLWDAATGKELNRFEGHTDHVLGVAFAPDGGLAASSAKDGTVRLWRLPAAPPPAVAVQPPPAPPEIKEVRKFEGHASGVWAVAVTPDGKHALSGSHDRTLRLWEIETGKEVRKFEGHKSQVYCVALSKDGKRALSGGTDKVVRLWDVESGKELRKFEGHTFVVRGVAFTPDGTKAVSGCLDQTLKVWDVEGGKELKTVTLPAAVLGVAVAPDGKHALAGCEDGAVVLCDLDAGKEVRKLAGHEGQVWSVAFSADGKQALTGGVDKTMRLWDVEGGKEVRKYVHTASVNCVAFSPDGKRAATGNADRAVCVWDVEVGRELGRGAGHGLHLTGVAFTPDGKHVVSASHDNTLRLWPAPQ